MIAKVEAGATPTIWLAFQSDTLSPLEITDVINRVVILLSVPLSMVGTLLALRL